MDDVVDLAQAAVYEVTERRTTEDYVVLEELLQPTMDEIEAIARRGGVTTGVPTGFTDLDRLTNGLHPGQLIIVAGPTRSRQGTRPGHAAAHPGRLDDDGRGRGRRVAVGADGTPTRSPPRPRC